ncbi:acyl-CoA dehydrogenase family protein [Nocardioides marmoraquaticus]
MDFTLDDEQKALRDAVRSLLSGFDNEQRRATVAEDPGFSEERWGQMAEMGLLGLPFSEADGGMGAGPVELSLVCEELGRVVAPEPYVESVVLAGGLVAALGTAEQKADVLGAVSAGERVLAAALLEPGSRWDLAADDVVEKDGALTGTKEPVLVGGRADQLVVSARTDAGLGLFLVTPGDGVTVTSYATFDGGRAARVVLDGAPATRLGDGSVDASAALERVVAAAKIAYCHEALGLMESALQRTSTYLTQRKQFDTTLNRFQALTFRAADMYTSVELTRSIVEWASMVIADPGSTSAQVTEAARRAKLQVSKAGRHVGQEAIQLHGGIAMTDEYAVGHMTARLTAIDHLLGDGRAQAAHLVGALTDHEVIDPLR